MSASQGVPRLEDISIVELQALLRYEPDTGMIYRLKRTGVTGPKPDMTKPVGSQCAKGYLVFDIRGRQYKLHRLAWALHTGQWPSLLIDHINGNRSDNRWINMREASYAQNTHNSDRIREGKGYSKRKDTGLYETAVRRFGQRLSAGSFASEAAARAAVSELKKVYL